MPSTVGLGVLGSASLERDGKLPASKQNGAWSEDAGDGHPTCSADP